MALNACCCCVPLRTGALTIAILYLVVNVGVLLGWAGWFFAQVASLMSLDDQSSDWESRRSRMSVKFSGFVLGMVSLVCGINITMDSLLVHGIRRNRRKFMLPWVVWYGIFTSLVSLTLIGICIWLLVKYVEAVKEPSESDGILIAFLIMIGCIAAIALPVMWYWYACVMSYYVVLAPSDQYVMESLREQETTGALLSHRPVKDGVGGLTAVSG